MGRRYLKRFCSVNNSLRAVLRVLFPVESSTRTSIHSLFAFAFIVIFRCQPKVIQSSHLGYSTIHVCPSYDAHVGRGVSLGIF